MSSAVHALRRLSRRGFQAQRLFQADGTAGALLYVKQHNGFRDVLLVDGDTSAVAFRTDHAVNPAQPFDVAPGFALSVYGGDLVEISNVLLTQRVNGDEEGRA